MKTENSSRLMRFFWSAAGGDRSILERATYSDKVKYMCLGGIVFATGAMAGLSGGYAFYTIFAPKGSALKDTTDMQTVFLSTLFGIIWGLMIFNLDRFIVAATGKGDGTEKITWDEFRGAIPRIIMGCIIAFTISKPIEIRMFKTEIDAALYHKQNELKAEHEKAIQINFDSRENELNKDFDKYFKELNDLQQKYNEYDAAYLAEVAEGQGGRIKGEGPVARKHKENRELYEKKIIAYKNENKKTVDDLNKRKEKLYAEKMDELSKSDKVAGTLDGLLERIKLAHEISGFWISLFITLLFMAIELTPIFFKLMLTKTPYDYLSENRDELLKASNGIEVKYDFYKDKEGVERHLVINHEAERMIFEKRKITEIQRELTEYAVEKYKDQEKSKIDENVEDYIQKISPNEEETQKA